MTASRIFLLSSLCSLCLCGESSAALDPQLKKPYQLRIVLHFAEHPQITPAFQERVGRELGDAVQAALGDLGIVEVAYKHDKLPEILQKGSKGLQEVLDSWKDRSGLKTHFVLIGFNGFEWEIQARQHDGVTGQASVFTGSVVRLERTRDRDFVARTAALMVARDFGFIGTIDGPTEKRGEDIIVKVVLKGGGLGVPLGPWVKEGEIFGLVGIPNASTGEKVFPWLFLRVEKPPSDEARDGVCICKLYHRYRISLENAGFAGFRCVKLGTTRGPVRLLLTQQNPSGTGSGEKLTLTVRRFGFVGEEGTSLRDPAQPDGSFDTTRPNETGLFNHLAFVTVQGGAARAVRIPQLPVPILTDRPLEVEVPAAAEGNDLLRFQREEWTRNVTDSYLVQANLFRRLNELSSKADERKNAVAEAQSGLERCRSDFARLTADRKELDLQIQQLPTANRPNLSAWDDRLKKMKDAEIALVNYLNNAEKIQREETDPARVKALEEMNRGRLLEQKYEYGQAIDIYENVRKIKGLDSQELQDRIARLRKAWTTKGDKHEAARKFIYVTFPALNTAGLKAKLEETKQAFAECKNVRDVLGPQKMAEVMLTHRQRIETELAQLKPQINVEDEPKWKDITEIVTELAKLETDLNAFLNEAAPSK